MLTHLPFNDLPGAIYRSPMPFGGYDPTGRTYAEMQGKGVTTVVMLVDDGEAMRHTGFDLRQKYLEDGLQVIQLPIGDFGIPDRAALQPVLAQVHALAQAGEVIAVHCHAGIGRTGLFLAMLARHALQISGDQAITWVRRYIPGAVETQEQIRFVRQA